MPIGYEQPQIRYIMLGLSGLVIATWVTQSMLTSPIKIMGNTQQAHQISLPLYFEENRGQTIAPVQYISRGKGATFFFTPQAITLALTDANATNSTKMQSMRLSFMHANPKPTLKGEALLTSKSHYLIGNNPAAWHQDIQHYAKIRYQQLYPHIDAIFYGQQQALEYDIRIAPGGDPAQVRLQVQGATQLHLNQTHDLALVLSPKHQIVMHRPVAYQMIQGKKSIVSADFFIDKEHNVGFKLGNYDKQQDLIIDPVLAYATYFGGSGAAEPGNAITTDAKGAIYVTGSTNSIDFPTQNPIQSTNLSGQRTAYVAKFTHDGKKLVYATYLGGTGGMDQGFAIKLGTQENAYVTGTTNSKNFPIKNAFQATNKSSNLSAFITKLSSDGRNILYSTYLGGTGFYNESLGIDVDLGGNAYVAGFTNSRDFPLQKPFQMTNNGTNITAFVAKLNHDGNRLLYATYIGGSGGNDRVQAIAVDNLGRAHITGITNSKDFPTQNPFQNQPKAVGESITGFVAQLNAHGDKLNYASYLGGSGGTDSPNGIALDLLGMPYITGYTNSNDFPVRQALQSTNHSSNYNAFVTKLANNGRDIEYSTYLGGSGGNDIAYAIDVDWRGRAYVIGQTNSTDFPMKNPLQATNNGPGTTTFLSKLNCNGNGLEFSTYLGGSGGDEKGLGIDIGTKGSVYIIGQTNSKDFPVKDAYQPTNLGSSTTSYIARID